MPALLRLDSDFWILPVQPAVPVAPAAVEALAVETDPPKLPTHPEISNVISISVEPASCCPAPLARRYPEELQAAAVDH